MIAALIAAATIVGVVPAALGTASHIVWIDADGSTQIACEVVAPARWQCEGVPETSQGLVALIGTDGVAHQCVAVCGGDSTIAVRRWARLIVLDGGGIAVEDLRQIRVTAWKPARSAIRTTTRRFQAMNDSDVDVIRLSDLLFWITGNSDDPDSFVSLDGPDIGSTRVRVSTLIEGPPELPLVVAAAPPYSLAGRVQDAAGQDVSQANVELFEALASGSLNGRMPSDSGPVILLATVQSDTSGAFTFDHLVPGVYFVSVIHDAAGRGGLWVKSPGEPVVVRLVAPARATGRVLKYHNPVASARVRFVPNAEAFMAAGDPQLLIAPEATTALDGSFLLTLPPETVGVIQVLGPDGTSMRVPVSGIRKATHFALGDISLPEHRVLGIRLLDAMSCTLSAAGPINYLGLTIVQAAVSGGIHWFDIPEPGQWALNAHCSGVSYSLVPTIVDVPASGPDANVDVHIVR